MANRRPDGTGGPAETSLESFYADVLTEEERSEMARQLASSQRTTEEEVAMMRVLIRRVMERIGAASDSERVLTGEAADSLSNAFGVALREIGEELGIHDE